MGKITRLYLSMSLAVIPNILLMSLGVTVTLARGAMSLGAAWLGGPGPSSSNRLGNLDAE